MSSGKSQPQAADKQSHPGAASESSGSESSESSSDSSSSDDDDDEKRALRSSEVGMVLWMRTFSQTAR
eukprot:SAG11_NODE_5881_length_1442_cov_1.313477_2_plen_68_part_00